MKKLSKPRKEASRRTPNRSVPETPLEESSGPVPQALTPKELTALGNGALFISQSGIQSTMQPGQKATVTITMKNMGSTTWTQAGEYKLGSQNPQDNTFWTGSPRIYFNPSEAITRPAEDLHESHHTIIPIFA